MDFLDATRLMWGLRADYPLSAPQADLMSRLLFLAGQQGKGDLADDGIGVQCKASAGSLLTSLDISERTLRRTKAELMAAGWLAQTKEADTYVLRLHQLGQPAKVAPTPRPVITRKPAPAPAPAPAAAPTLVLTPEPVKPTVSDVPVAPTPTAPIIVNGSGVKLSYAESLQAAAPAQCLDLEAFEKWLEQEAPKLLGFRKGKKQAITAHQLTDLYRKFDPKLLAQKLRAMDNKPNLLSSYDSAHRTLEHWCNMELARANSNWQNVPDSNPLPGTLRFLAEQAGKQQATAAATPSLFADLNSVAGPAGDEANQRALNRASRWGSNTTNSGANA